MKGKGKGKKYMSMDVLALLLIGYLPVILECTKYIVFLFFLLFCNIILVCFFFRFLFVYAALLLPPSDSNRLRTASRWLENFKCVSNFWAVISGPGV